MTTTTPIRHDTVMVYAVYWPKANVLKVGRAWKMSRVRGLMSTGGELLLLMRNCPLWEEGAALKEMRANFDRAFTAELDATHILPRGRGFTECFTVTMAQLQHAIDTIFRGIARHGYEQAKDAAAGHLHGRSSDRTGPGGATDGDRAAVARGRSREGVGESRTGEGRGVAVVTGNQSRGAGNAPVGAGSGGVHHPVRGGRADVLRDHGMAGSEPRGTLAAPGTGGPVDAPVLPEHLWKLARGLHGCGEGESRERERRGGRSMEGRRGHFRKLETTSFKILPRAPHWNFRTLRALRDGETTSVNLGCTETSTSSSRVQRRRPDALMRTTYSAQAVT